MTDSMGATYGSDPARPEGWPSADEPATIDGMAGTIYCGDNLDVLEEYLAAASVDLIYLDPPFNSQRTYNQVYPGSRAQEEAFKDYWLWTESADTFEKLVTSTITPKPLRTMLRALHDVLIENDSDQLAYLSMMTARLLGLHRVLKPAGSLYLHCDPAASHYLKLILDSIFGSDSFRNEIVWRRSRAHNDRGLRRYGAVHDIIFFYTKGDGWTFTTQHTERDPNAPKTHDLYRHTDGVLYRKDNCRAPGNRGPRYPWNGHTHHWRFSPDERDRLIAAERIVYSKSGMPRLLRPIDPTKGSPLQDVWSDIDPPNSGSDEYLGYPTQKPVALLERILTSSSKEGDIVLDPFCGCGTTIEACETLGRRWIGIDIATKAVEVIEERFKRLNLEPPPVTWYPVDVQSARALAERSKSKFEEWVCRKLRARKRSKDRGIDGEAFFRDPDGKIWQVIISVKGGKLKPADLRDLGGTVERESRETRDSAPSSRSGAGASPRGDATIGVFVSIEEPTKEMLFEAARAKFLSVSDEYGPIPRMQLVRIDDAFFKPNRIRVPGVNVTDMPNADGEQLRLGLNPAKGIRAAVVRGEAEQGRRVASIGKPASKPPPR